MPIDWFTVSAQILNFIVLVWILKRFLYQPVLKIMAERQERVENNMLAATREKEASARERASFEEKSRDLDQKRESLLKKAEQDAEKTRRRNTEEAKAEYETLRERWRKSLTEEQDDLNEKISTSVQKESLAIAGKLVRDLADTELQERVANKFIKMLETMPATEKANLAAPVKESNSSAVLRSATDLDAGLREKLEAAIRSIIGPEAPLSFETKPTIGVGIELAVDGCKAAWTIDNYLGSLDTGLRELMERATANDEKPPQ